MGNFGNPCTKCATPVSKISNLQHRPDLSSQSLNRHNTNCAVSVANTLSYNPRIVKVNLTTSACRDPLKKEGSAAGDGGVPISNPAVAPLLRA